MKKLLFYSISLLFILLFSCNNENRNVEEYKLPNINFIYGLASPVQLEPDSTSIRIKDYIPEDVEITKITTHEAIQAEFSDDSSRLIVKVVSDDLPKLSFLDLEFGWHVESILLKKTHKIKQEFVFDPQGKNYSKVQIKGEFNAWNPNNTDLQYIDGKWKTEVQIEPGTYQYLFVLNGTEKLDPANPAKVSNGMGGFNSVLKAGHIDQSQLPIIQTANHDDNVLYISSQNTVSEYLVCYRNMRLDNEFLSLNNDSLRIIIPKDENKNIGYIRVWSYNDHGISNDLLIPYKNGKVVSNTKDLSRTDFHTATIYNTFVDRFYDGNVDNNRPTKDKSIHPRANFHGGDISGITQKIQDGYFKDLGINSIWISPIVKNPEDAWGLYPNPVTKFSSYHGYWPISFTLIDDRFGTEEEFKQMVEIAHEHDMNVFLDFVANHVHQNHPVYQANKDWATNLYLPDGTLNTEKWDEHRLTTWFDVFLPTLDLEKPEVYEMLSDSAVYWIKKYKLDGFRHDATKHIPEIFWQTLTHKLKTEIIIPENRKLFQIGETYGSPQLISSYVNTGQLDAQFDFNVYDASVAAVTGNTSFENLARVLKTSQKYYGSNHLMGNITGNQDRGRFISYASGSLQFDEDAKFAGWTREIGIKDSIAYDKCAILNSIVATIPGIPVIFYGDEIGIPGGNDPDNRKMMRFNGLNDKEQRLKETTKKLLNFRKQTLALLFGDFNIIEASEDVFIFSRTYFDETVILAINNSNEPKTISFDSKANNQSVFQTLFGSELNQENILFQIKLEAVSFDIISNTRIIQKNN